MLSEIAKQHGIEWEQKDTHEEHLDVYNFKKRVRKKEVQELEKEKESLIEKNNGLAAEIEESRETIQSLENDKEQVMKEKELAEQRVAKTEKDLKSLEKQRERLQPIMDQVSAEIKKCGTIHTMLPKTSFFEGASTYREKIKPTFVNMQDNIAAMTAQIKELMSEVKEWKENNKKLKQKYSQVKSELETVSQENKQLKEEKGLLEGISEKYHSVVRVLGIDVVESAVQEDNRSKRMMEELRYMEHMPQGSIQERLRWGKKKIEIDNKKIKSNIQKRGEIER